MQWCACANIHQLQLTSCERSAYDGTPSAPRLCDMALNAKPPQQAGAGLRNAGRGRSARLAPCAWGPGTALPPRQPKAQSPAAAAKKAPTGKLTSLQCLHFEPFLLWTRRPSETSKKKTTCLRPGTRTTSLFACPWTWPLPWIHVLRSGRFWLHQPSIHITSHVSAV